ncbi:hypothetical protein [Peribacillus acanthi]|uniref:hypothetical protein n=1 Tax=Peribacillus acanthi TaxID=2171554 RepID=UPI000D3E33E4|nr:hypothetical protein [Peribacillus acanthi]
MKRSYSRYNLLQEKLRGNRPKRLFHSFFSSGRKYITLVVGYYDYLRGKVFIDDLLDTFEEAPEFDIAVLIHLLYQDFMNQIKKGYDNRQIALFLRKKKTEYLEADKQEKKVMKQVTQNIFTFETTEEDVESPHGEREKQAHITIRIKETELLRGEIFLHDLSPFMAHTTLTIEDLMVILYLDFIKQVKENGNSSKIQKSILHRLNNL